LSPGGRWQRTLYTPQGQIWRSWGTSAWPVEYGYDHGGRLTNLVTWQQFDLGSGQGTGGQARTAWRYDPQRGWLVAKWYADPTTGVPTESRAVRYTWTAGGRLHSRQWTRGLVTTYGYNAAGELESVQYSGGAVGYTNRYDRRGRLIEVVQGPVTLRRWYSAAGELISESWTGGELDGVRVTNLVDSLGRRIAQEVWRGTQPLSRVDYTWGGGDRLLSVSDELGHRADYDWEPLAPMGGR
jgi:YD repeat-containing protein